MIGLIFRTRLEGKSCLTEAFKFLGMVGICEIVVQALSHNHADVRHVLKFRHSGFGNGIETAEMTDQALAGCAAHMQDAKTKEVEQKKKLEIELFKK